MRNKDLSQFSFTENHREEQIRRCCVIGITELRVPILFEQILGGSLSDYCIKNMDDAHIIYA